MSDAAPEPAGPTRSWRVLAAGAAATVVVGFVAGFALGGRSADRGEDLTASAPSPTTVASPGSTDSTATTSAAAPSTSSTSTTATTSTTAAIATSSTAAPTTSVVEPFPTIATTVAPPTTVATAPPPAPSRVVVSHATDGSGRLIIPRSGSANLVITNEGGLAQQWLVTGTGFTTAGATQGTLAPGQTVTVTLLAPPGELPNGEITGIVSVLGAINPSVPFVIPAA